MNIHANTINVGPLTHPVPESVYRTPIGSAKPGVALRGVIYGGSGYAQENLPIALALSRHGIPVRIEPVMQQHDAQNLLPPEARIALEFMKLQPVDLSRGVYFQAVPAHDLIPNVYARKRVCRTMFETDSIPAGWTEKCNQMDEVWVPSAFNFETFLRAGVDETSCEVDAGRGGHGTFQARPCPFRNTGNARF